MRRWCIFLLGLLVLQSAAGAQTVVTSVAPESASVTVYRDPDRRDGPINARLPRGYALVSEVRRLALPAGDAVIRFEGVADGILAVSAVVTGLPGGVTQKNRDARLLSPAALVDGTLGKRVRLRRTDRATGKVTEQDAIIRSTSANALVLETDSGIEGLRCSGLPESLSFDALPPGLSAKPTLSVSTSSPAATTVDVTLTYLADGFDWNASYVAQIAPDGRTLSLFGWMTVANGGGTGFENAQLLAVAGRPDRNAERYYQQDDWVSPSLSLQCWSFDGYAAPDDRSDWRGGFPPPPPVPPPPPMAIGAMQEIVVTSRRMAEQENLGDLKLYRVPMRVDINPNGQKQVALLERKAIGFDSFYRIRLDAAGASGGWQPLMRVIRFPNTVRNGAGLPLPAGKVALFGTGRGETILLVEDMMRDHAIGEKVEIAAGENAQLRLSQARGADDLGRRLTVTNAAPAPAIVEVELAEREAGQLRRPSQKLKRRDGLWLWTVTVPANGTAQLDYSVTPPAQR